MGTESPPEFLGVPVIFDKHVPKDQVFIVNDGQMFRAFVGTWKKPRWWVRAWRWLVR